MKHGEPHGNGYAEKISRRLHDRPVGDVGSFTVHINTAPTTETQGGVRLRPGEGVVKTSGGRLVARFDRERWETCDTSLVKLLADELGDE